MSSRDVCGLFSVMDEGQTIKDVAVQGYSLRQDSFIASQICIEVSDELKTLPEQIFQVLGVLSRRCLPHHILASPEEPACKGNVSVCAGPKGDTLARCKPEVQLQRLAPAELRSVRQQARKISSSACLATRECSAVARPRPTQTWHGNRPGQLGASSCP